MNKTHQNNIQLLKLFLINMMVYNIFKELKQELGCKLALSRFLVFFCLAIKYKTLGVKISQMPYKGIYHLSSAHTYTNSLFKLGYLLKRDKGYWLVSPEIYKIVIEKLNKLEIEVDKTLSYFIFQVDEG